jgi:mono/diheme cytochrome c family protein
MKRRKIALLCFALMSVLAFAARHSHWDHVPAKDHARANPAAAQPNAVAAGALIYGIHCAQCHGSDARGDGRKHPSLRSEVLRNATDGDIEWFLRQGDLAHGMPSWASLPSDQRWQIVTYLKSLQ